MIKRAVTALLGTRIPRPPPGRTPPSQSNPFPEERLDLPTLSGSGYWAGRAGDVLKDGGVYTVTRKLGWGGYSNVWLASSSEGFSSFAIKVYTAHATQLHRLGHLHELDAWLRVQATHNQSVAPLLHLVDHFTHLGPLGEHLCLVTYPCAQSVSDYLSTAPNRCIPPLVVKRIVTEVLYGLEILHARRIIHTGNLKADNILFAADADAVDAAQAQPSTYDPSTLNLGGVDYPLMRSAPIRMPWKAQDDPYTSELYTLRLVDLGQAQLLDGLRVSTTIQPVAMRAPEVLLQAPFGTAVDIWNLGCLTFELLSGVWLFDPTANDGVWTAEDDHLNKMAAMTGQRFPAELLAAGRQSKIYFNEKGASRIWLQAAPLTDASVPLANYDVDQLDVCLSFLSACLELDPGARASANDLLKHPWLEEASC
ncbi:kinase-like domain-containing protein [Mycena pura]|uniref:non-specific serine/threonine protein kinase n=1 Tax=Mycena pura TaxID=153505 RepID=A0AAD6V716_9AGAR|nr:kinase-like domain-containing protein [Mycena pura]